MATNQRCYRLSADERREEVERLAEMIEEAVENLPVEETPTR